MRPGLNGFLAALLAMGACVACTPERRARTDPPPIDPAPESARLRQSCETDGKAESCVDLARRLRADPARTASDDARIRELLERAAMLWSARCDRGEREACALVARIANKRLLSIPRDDPAGDDVARMVVDALEKGCRAGDGPSCRDAARAYVRGEHLAPDPERARSLAERACTDSLTEGCTELGFLYADGVGVAADVERARSLFERGCTGGDGGGCMALGGLYAGSRVEPPDMARATSLFEQGCRLKYAGACSTLGELFLRGQGVPRDEAQGLRWMMQACELGDLSACNETRSHDPPRAPPAPASPLF
jgi:uncharacterized protein